METVTSADGTTIGYDVHGSGQPIICLHGTGVTRDIWTPLVGHLQETVTLVVPDRRGRGDSGDTEPWSFERERQDVRALLDEFPNASLLGSSFGGLLALRVAQREPVSHLVLYEPPLPAYTVQEEAYESLADRVADLIATGDRAAAVRLFFEEATGADDVEQWPIWPECIELAETIAREAAVVESFQLPEDPVAVPTLLLTGQYSPQYLGDGIDVLADTIPECQVVTISAGHAGVATAPAEVANAVETFLA